MSLLISLTTLLTLALPAQAADEGAKAAAVAPLVGEEVALVVHIDLTKWDVQKSIRRILGKLADDPELTGPTKLLTAWVDELKKAGAKDLFVLADPSDMPGFPVVVIPLAAGADSKGISAILLGKGPNATPGLPACETIRGAVVAGTRAALSRIKAAKPVERPELADALKAGGDATIRLALIPSTTQRRAVEESMPMLPPQFGGGPISNFSRGLSWAGLSLAFVPSPTLRAVDQARDAEAAKSLQKIFQDALGLLAQESRKLPEVAEIAPAIEKMKPEVKGNTISLEADLEKTASLVAVPVRQAREAARRSQCMNNLKQLGLALHNYHDANDSFPPAFNQSKDGKPLLSWRVHILPYLDQKALYEEFHLDEPWDSVHNKALIPRMPTTYSCPSGDKALAAEGKTSYLAPRGPATIFPGSQRVKLQEITDGTSNTIFVVEANDAAAVFWSKPEDWEVVPTLKPDALFGRHPGGMNVGFADGSVRFLKETITPKLLQALVTRNGGEVISADDY